MWVNPSSLYNSCLGRLTVDTCPVWQMSFVRMLFSLLLLNLDVVASLLDCWRQDYAVFTTAEEPICTCRFLVCTWRCCPTVGYQVTNQFLYCPRYVGGSINQRFKHYVCNFLGLDVPWGTDVLSCFYPLSFLVFAWFAVLFVDSFSVSPILHLPKLVAGLLMLFWGSTCKHDRSSDP